MGTNSIRHCIKKERLISQVRARLSADTKREKVFVVVEGPDDVAFFKSRVSSKIEILPLGPGKRAVLVAIKACDEIGQLHPHKDRVIGICDRDYDPLLEHGRVFYYDHCNLETMMASNDNTMNQLANEFYFDNYTGLELRDKILQELKWFSVLRKLNSENHWMIVLDACSVAETMKETHSFQIEKAKAQLENARKEKIEKEEKLPEKDRKEKHKKQLSECFAEVDEFFISSVANKGNLLDITQGHDFLNCFACLKKPRIQVKDIACFFRIAYRPEDFENTNLCKALRKYEGEHNLQILTPQPT